MDCAPSMTIIEGDFHPICQPCLSGSKFIKHKQRIENIIDTSRKEIRQEEIGDILET